MLKEEKFTQDDWLKFTWSPEYNGPNDFAIQEQWRLVAGLNDWLEVSCSPEHNGPNDFAIQEQWPLVAGLNERLGGPWFPEHSAQRREVLAAGAARGWWKKP